MSGNQIYCKADGSIGSVVRSTAYVGYICWQRIHQGIIGDVHAIFCSNGSGETNGIAFRGKTVVLTDAHAGYAGNGEAGHLIGNAVG